MGKTRKEEFELNECCMYGDVKKFNTLIKRVKFTQDELNDALYEASLMPNIEPEIFKGLLTLGANPNFRREADEPNVYTGEGNPPASFYEHQHDPVYQDPILSNVIANEYQSQYQNIFYIVNFLIMHGADIFADNNDAAYQAVKHHKPEVLKMLNELGAGKNEFQETRIIYLSKDVDDEYSGRQKIIETLDYLIFDMNIPIDDSTKINLKNLELYDTLKKINSRDLHFDFEQKLAIKPQTQKQSVKLKI